MALPNHTPATRGVTPDFGQHYRLEIGVEILRAMGAGESLAAVCRREGMPTATTVYRWAERYEEFGEAFRKVRQLVRQERARGVTARREHKARARKGVKNPLITGRPSSYDPAMARFICERLMEGMGLQAICRIEGTPSVMTVYNWLHARPQFAKAYGRARRVQAIFMDEEAREVAMTTAPGEIRQAEKVLRAMRQRAAVTSAKAWSPEDRPPEVSASPEGAPRR